MSATLKAKQAINESLLPYTSMRIDERKAEILEATRMIINPDDKNLKVVYTASGSNLKDVVLATGGTEFHMIDRTRPSAYAIRKDRWEMGAHLKGYKLSGNKLEITFEWEGKVRKAIFYELYISKNSIGELPPVIKEGYDVYFEKSTDTAAIRDPAVIGALLNGLKLGGFCVTDYELGGKFSLEKIPVDNKFGEPGYEFGRGRLNISRKADSK